MQHREHYERWLRFTVMDRISRDFDVRCGVVAQNGVAAVCIPDTARKVAAGDVHLQATPGGERVMDVAKMNRQRIDLFVPPDAAVLPHHDTSPVPPHP